MFSVKLVRFILLLVVSITLGVFSKATSVYAIDQFVGARFDLMSGSSHYEIYEADLANATVQVWTWATISDNPVTCDIHTWGYFKAQDPTVHDLCEPILGMRLAYKSHYKTNTGVHFADRYQCFVNPLAFLTHPGNSEQIIAEGAVTINPFAQYLHQFPPYCGF